MFCTSCGRPLHQRGAFCSGCGAAVAPEDRAVPARRGRLLTILTGAAILSVAGAAGLVMTSFHRPASDHPTAVAATKSGSVTTTATPTAIKSTAGDFAALYEQTADGVVRVETTSCGDAGVGSGFLVDDDLLATAAHVVGDASTIAVRQGSQVTSGTVVGMDAGTDLALVRTDRPLAGHVFSLSRNNPVTGSDAAVIGYPLGGPETFTKVSVGGLDRSIEVDGAARHGLTQISGGVNPGNSGGPLLDTSGAVIGIVDAKETDAEGIAWAIPSTGAAQLREWQLDPTPVDTSGSCEAPTGSDDLTLTVVNSTGDPDGASVADSLSEYADAIDSGDWDTAYDHLTPAAQARTPYDEFVDGSLTSYFVLFELESLSGGGETRTAHARFTTVQDESESSIGESCTDWSMTYRLVRVPSGWQIDRATPDPGSPAAC